MWAKSVALPAGSLTHRAAPPLGRSQRQDGRRSRRRRSRSASRSVSSCRRASLIASDVRQQVDGDGLAEQRAAEVGDRLQATQLTDRRLRRAHPADAQAAPEQLAHGADRQHRRPPREGGDRRRRLAGERQLGEREVLDHRCAGHLAQPGDLAAGVRRHDRAGRVVVRGHQVHGADRVAGEGRREDGDVGARLVRRDGEDPRTGSGGGVDRARERRILDEEQLVGPQVVRHHEADRLLRAGRDRGAGARRWAGRATSGGRRRRGGAAGSRAGDTRDRVRARRRRGLSRRDRARRAPSRTAVPACPSGRSCRPTPRTACGRRRCAGARWSAPRHGCSRARRRSPRSRSRAPAAGARAPARPAAGTRRPRFRARCPAPPPAPARAAGASRRAARPPRSPPAGRRPAACRAVRRRPASLRAPAGDQSQFRHDWTRSLDLFCRHEQGESGWARRSMRGMRRHEAAA